LKSEQHITITYEPPPLQKQVEVCASNISSENGELLWVLWSEEEIASELLKGELQSKLKALICGALLVILHV